MKLLQEVNFVQQQAYFIHFATFDAEKSIFHRIFAKQFRKQIINY